MEIIGKTTIKLAFTMPRVELVLPLHFLFHSTKNVHNKTLDVENVYIYISYTHTYVYYIFALMRTSENNAKKIILG